jgi:hypothetical protein
MTTLQERRHRKASNSIAHTVAQRDEAIARLVRLESRLKLLRKQQQRLERIMAAPPKPAPGLHCPDTATAEAAPSPAGDEPIPTFLDRRNLIADPKTKDRNAERRAIEKEKRDAKLTGELKKMPLSGRAALAKINAG